MAALGVCLLQAYAQQETPQGVTVKEVRIEGLERVSDQVIRSQLEIQPGLAFNDRAIARDIKRLFDTTYFSTVRVESSEPSGGEVIVTYIVEEKQVIGEVKIVGNDKVRTRNIRGALSWREGDTFVPEAYEEEREAVLRVYESKGIPNTSVDIVVEKVGPSRVRITYLIDEGRKARIHSIAVEGNEALSDRKVRRSMATKRRWWFLGGKYDEEKFNADMGAIKDKYGDVGRLEAEVTRADLQYTENAKGLNITIYVDEGPEYSVGSLELADNTVFDDDEIMGLLKVEAGDIHNRGQVEADAQTITKGYADSGYVNAETTPQVTLNRDNNTTNVVHRVAEGDLKYVKEIKITGNDVTRDDVIRREVFMNPGERFDGSLMEATRIRLNNTEYFEAVRMNLEDIEGDDEFSNLIIDVDEGKTGFWNFGFGYNTDEGFGGYTELKFDNFDIMKWPTFSGGGQQLRIRLALGQRRTEYNISFTDPEFLGYPLGFGFDLFDESVEYTGGTDYTEESRGIQLRFAKVLSPYVTARAAYRFRSVNYSDFDTGLFNPYRDYLGGDTTSSTLWGINRTTVDNTRDATRGARHDLQIEFAGLGGDNDFYKLDHDSTWYWSFGEEKKWVLSYRSRQGIGGTWGNSDVIPLSDRYFAGGSTTVRGYDNRDIGPKVKEFIFFGEERAVGGELRLLNSVEIKYKVNKMLRLYGFIDGGGVWLEPSDFGFGDMKYGAGVGIGFDVPRFGPIRLDYAVPLNPEDDQGGGKFHLQGGFRF
ncbi:MAG: outer membrane protein [Candidatus Hydrogenedentota bacterium]